MSNFSTYNTSFSKIQEAYESMNSIFESSTESSNSSQDSSSDIDTIFNEPCETTMQRIAPNSVDIVLTSPPYDTTRGRMAKSVLSNGISKSGHGSFPSSRYDVFTADKTPDEYISWTVSLFNFFDRILKKNGVVLYNMSYTADDPDTMWLVLGDVIRNTPFTIAEHIVWRKSTAIPNNMSPNRLTRITENVFVFARKSELKTFICSKEVSGVRANGQKMYRSVRNYIEAANNDGPNSLNKATFSSSLCEQLLKIYGKREMVIYDPFMGTGTTAVAARRLGMRYIGSELSKKQIDYANDRISKVGVSESFDRDEDVAFQDYYEIFDDMVEDIINQFKNYPEIPQQRELLPQERIEKIWNDYAKYGFVRDENGISMLAELAVRAVARLEANTMLNGHTRTNNEEYVREMVIDMSKEEWERFYDWDIGEAGISDYGTEPLVKLAIKLMCAKSAEEKLQILDQMFNVYHANGDLSKNFVKDGSAFFDKLSAV